MTSEALTPATARTFPQFIRAVAAAYGDDIALTLKGDTIPDEEISFRELEARSAELGRGLLARGAGKGSRIGFIYGNSPSFAVMFAAIARIGAIAVPISTMVRANELTRILRQSDIAGLILQRRQLGHDYVERMLDALPELRECGPELRLGKVPYLRWIVSFGEDLPDSIRPISFLTEAAAGTDDALLRAVEAEVHPADQLMEIYTSGSMALPKGVRHLHGPILARSHFLTERLNAARGKAGVAVMPLFWVGGLMLYFFPNLEAGGVTICTESTSGNSRFAMGTVMQPEDLEMMRNQNVFWALGMTETAGPYAYGDVLRDPRYPLCTPLDHVAPGYEVRLADAAGNPVPEGERGEIQVRGYMLTPGLHKVEREGYFLPDGFYRTGDLGVAEGSTIHFIGRDGDMIKSANSNVSPAEVEMELQSLPGVQSAYVLGLPDQERGQIVVAALVPRDGMTLDVTAIQAQMKARLSSFKVPRIFVPIERAEVPMLPTNKVSRRGLEQLLAEKLGRS